MLKRVTAWIGLIGFIALLLNLTFLHMYLKESLVVYIFIMVLFLFISSKKSQKEREKEMEETENKKENKEDSV